MSYSSKEAQREYQRKWMAKRRSDFFSGKSCASCGATDNLELDHIDPTTKVSHRIWSWSATRRAAELAKCQVLCAECHDQKSLREFPITSGLEFAKHGTPSKYQRGCRCRPCTTAKVDEVSKYRLRKFQDESGMLFPVPRGRKAQKTH